MPVNPSAMAAAHAQHARIPLKIIIFTPSPQDNVDRTMCKGKEGEHI